PLATRREGAMPRATRQRREPTDDWHQLRLLARFPEQLTYELIRPVVLFGSSPAERARQTGAPQRTLYRPAARFETDGMAGLRPRQDESAVVALDDVAKPFRARFGADQDEDRRRRDLLAPAHPDVLQRQGLEAGLAAAVDHPHAEPDLDVGGRLDLRDQVVGH